jgi:hypothetical protein
MTANTQQGDDGLDLLWGASEIGRAIKQTPRQAYHMLETGQLPARKVCGKWVVERDALRRHFTVAA